MFRRWGLLFLMMLLPAAAVSAPLDSIIVTDASLTGPHAVWSPDSANFYLLNGRVFVETGDTLEILPGTVIKGMPGGADSASALLVARKGYIICDGLPNNPIIFTAQADDPADMFDMPLHIKGLWGGLVILGIAHTNIVGDSNHIEGIPITESRGIYGPGATYTADDADNSGIVRYTSIRYSGTIIGANNEINGLSLGAVGSGTTIDYVETYHVADDGFEFFGGTVNCKHLISAWNDDDGYDWDESFRGKGQYWLVYQGKLWGNRGSEEDGGTIPEDGQPYAIPIISNATYIGRGPTADAVNDFGIIMRDNSGGKYYNSIFAGFFGKALSIETEGTGENSQKRLDSGDIVYNRTMWYDFNHGLPGGDLPDSIFLAAQPWVKAYMTQPAQANTFGVNPRFRSYPSDTRDADSGFNPIPQVGGPAASGGIVPADPFFDNVTFKGAFDPNGPNWALGWTALDFFGYFGDTNACASVMDGDVNASNTITSSDIIALVNFVFKGGAAPLPCVANGDVNCSGTVTSSDVISLVNFVFKGGAPPCDICHSATAQNCT
jgi:hypothetical protein